MWSLQRRSNEADDSFLVQSFVRETRVLDVQSARDVEMDDEEERSETMEEGGALTEVTIPEVRQVRPWYFSCSENQQST